MVGLSRTLYTGMQRLRSTPVLYTHTSKNVLVSHNYHPILELRLDMIELYFNFLC